MTIFTEIKKGRNSISRIGRQEKKIDNKVPGSGNNKSTQQRILYSTEESLDNLKAFWQK